MSAPTVFLSAVTRDIGLPLLDDLSRVIENDLHCHCRYRNNLKPAGTLLPEKLHAEIRAADAVIHLVGPSFGFGPQDVLDPFIERTPAGLFWQPMCRTWWPFPDSFPARRSYTQMEYDFATKLLKPTWVIFIDDTALAATAAAGQSADDAALQAAHRRAIGARGHEYVTVPALDTLRRAVADLPILVSELKKENAAQAAHIASTDQRLGSMDAKLSDLPTKNDLRAALAQTRPILRTHNLRTPVPLFGRDHDLQFLLDGITQTQRHSVVISGVHGLGGVGKTELALTLAQRLAPEFPDAQIQLDLRGFDPAGNPPLSPDAILSHVINAFHPEAKLPDDLPALQDIYRSVLSQAGRVLLLLDNARDADQITPAIPPPNCLLLITSRNHFTLPIPMVSKDITSLAPAAAADLLLARAPRLGSDAPHAARLCGHLPLPLRVFADTVARQRLRPVPDLLQALADHAAELSPQDAAFRTSQDALPPQTAQLWLALGVFTGSFDQRAVLALTATAFGKPDTPPASPADTVAQLQTLIDASLLEFDDSTRRFRLHDLVRDYVLRQQPPALLHTLRQAHARHYTAIGWETDSLYKTKGKAVEGLALFDAEREQIEAAYGWLAARTAGDSPARTPPRSAADHSPPADATARQLIALVDAIAYTSNLRFHPRQRIAWLESQLQAAREIGDRAAEGVALGNLGLAHAALGDARQAIEFYEQHLVIAREIGDRRGEGAALGNLGNAHANLGDARKAIAFYEQHRDIAREIGDRRGEGNAVGNLGSAHYSLGDARTAIEFYEQRLVIAREIGDRRGEGKALGNLGLAHADLGDARKAIEFYEQRLVIAREIGDRRGEGSALGNLGSAHAALGDARKAIEFYEQALVIAREIGDRRGEGTDLWNSALQFEKLGDRAEAVARARAALAIFEAIEDPWAAKVRSALARWEGG